MRSALLQFAILALCLDVGLCYYPMDSSTIHDAKGSLTESPSEGSNTYDYYLLPTAIKPQKYILRVITHLEDPSNLSFVGEVAMHLRVLQDTSNITLHAQNLTINAKHITLRNLKSKELTRDNCIRSTQVNNHHNYYIMHLCEPIRRGEQYVLTMPFSNELSRNLLGYYRSSYRDKASNETRWLAVTQFEPANARKAFPCFDEPAYKATFIVILGHNNKYTALSNMPLKETRSMADKKDWIWSEFHESVPMSTYLVAYTINDFTNVKSNTEQLRNKVQFRTWARRDAIDQCHFAGIVGPQVLEYYEDIFDIKFPLEKIDQIAIPDFGAGAMENWGLVTYRETALLYAERVSSLSNKQRVAQVIAHELAHQWFGNLVTMKWWTDLWLNEGFATYIASLGVEHISPDWNSLTEESVSNTLDIYRLDALKSSHPISQRIQHVSEIHQIFDSISYKKGSAVLRMMHLFLGDESFQSGLHNYLKKHAYDNAEQDNLWSSLTDAAHKYRSLPSEYSIKRIMDSWTLQTGYPIITITRDYDRQTATVSQMRYLLDTEAMREADHNCWWVPLSYTSQKQANFDNVAPKQWLQCTETNEAINLTVNDMPGRDEWIIFNVQMSGLYKVKYDERNWNMLIETLMSAEFEKIHTINRAQLIDDALTLAWSGDMDYEIAMRLVEYLVREQEYIPWKAALDNLARVNRILRQTSEYEHFKKFMRKILTPIYLHLNGLNVTSEKLNAQATLHKVLIAAWSCRIEVEDCVTRALSYYQEWRAVSDPDEDNPIPTNLRSVVYCTAMRKGNEDDWQFLWNRYKNSNVAAEKSTIISALGCSREVWLLQRYLQWAFESDSHIRRQDSSSVFGSVVRGEIGFHLARDYFLSNFDMIYKFYQNDGSELSRFVSPLASEISTQRDYEVVQKFCEDHKQQLKKAEQSVRRALETIQINVQWKEHNFIDITSRLRSLTE